MYVKCWVFKSLVLASILILISETTCSDGCQEKSFSIFFDRFEGIREALSQTNILGSDCKKKRHSAVVRAHTYCVEGNGLGPMLVPARRYPLPIHPTVNGYLAER